VIEAYGWTTDVLDDARERSRRLYERNRQIVAGDHPGYQGPG